jgi:hypothetical protein
VPRSRRFPAGHNNPAAERSARPHAFPLFAAGLGVIGLLWLAASEGSEDALLTINYFLPIDCGNVSILSVD